MKSLLAKILLVFFLIVEVSCGEDIPDCPNKLCVLAGGWRLVEVYIDGVKDTSTDLSKYRLTLFMPNPTTAITSDFDRVNPSGREDTGTWEVRNNSTILVLLPDSSPEEPYIIKYFTPRQLILVIDRDENKTGPSEYEYVLEPF
jgi:Lipocalin-like domain